MKKAMVYIQSGGPTSVINTSLYGAIMEARKHPEQIEGVYGSLNGIEGLINDVIIDLNKEDQEQLDLLKQTPGAALGTTRFKLPTNIHDPIYLKIINTIRKHNIGYVFVNGGNDSMDTCYKLSLLFKEQKIDAKVMGVPKTIDNDLAITDHSLGFGSAAKCVCNIVQSVCIDAGCYKKGKVFIIEIMGRNAGWLTASVDLLPEGERPDFIHLPENTFDVEEFLADVNKVYKEKGHCIVAISEGIVFERDTSTARVDAFNHIQLGGAADALSQIVEKRLGLPTRSIELSLIQRADPIHISKVDSDEAIACAAKAVCSAIEGETGKMVAIKRLSSHPYKTELILGDLAHIANEERTIPGSMMAGKSHMSNEFKDYCLPLIQGEIDVKFVNGILAKCSLKKVLVK